MFCALLGQISGERLQGHLSSGLSFIHKWPWAKVKK